MGFPLQDLMMLEPDRRSPSSHMPLRRSQALGPVISTQRYPSRARPVARRGALVTSQIQKPWLEPKQCKDAPSTRTTLYILTTIDTGRALYTERAATRLLEIEPQSQVQHPAAVSPTPPALLPNRSRRSHARLQPAPTEPGPATAPFPAASPLETMESMDTGTSLMRYTYCRPLDLGFNSWTGAKDWRVWEVSWANKILAW